LVTIKRLGIISRPLPEGIVCIASCWLTINIISLKERQERLWNLIIPNFFLITFIIAGQVKKFVGFLQ
jgi:hypothetical protein